MVWQVSEMEVLRMNSELWRLYGAWDISGESQEVSGQSTWPMLFEGEHWGTVEGVGAPSL